MVRYSLLLQQRYRLLGNRVRVGSSRLFSKSLWVAQPSESVECGSVPISQAIYRTGTMTAMEPLVVMARDCSGAHGLRETLQWVEEYNYLRSSGSMRREREFVAPSGFRPMNATYS